VLHGRVWMEHPVSVVADDGEVLAVRLEPGSPFTFHEHPFGPHPWGAQDAWGVTTVLQLYREGDAYAVWKFFEREVFLFWYVNFEAPIVRHSDGFATDDHGLDLVLHPDGRREWKDVDHLAELVSTARMTGAEVLGVLRAARGVVEQLDADQPPWWAAWSDWHPPTG
jgi:hypothetical protein